MILKFFGSKYADINDIAPIACKINDERASLAGNHKRDFNLAVTKGMNPQESLSEYYTELNKTTNEEKIKKLLKYGIDVVDNKGRPKQWASTLAGIRTFCSKYEYSQTPIAGCIERFELLKDNQKIRYMFLFSIGNVELYLTDAREEFGQVWVSQFEDTFHLAAKKVNKQFKKHMKTFKFPPHQIWLFAFCDANKVLPSTDGGSKVQVNKWGISRWKIMSNPEKSINLTLPPAPTVMQ